MTNKLKNILKTGILYKRLSLRQLVTFFSGVRYSILDIVDPSCFNIEINKTQVVEDVTYVNTQELADLDVDDTRPSGERPFHLAAKLFSQEDDQKKKKSKPFGGARNRNSSIRRTRNRSNNGGKTRKSKYSRKHRSHRKGSSTRQRKRR